MARLATSIGRNGFSIQAIGNEPLTDDQIIRVCPSIYAPEAHDSRSDRYVYIPTVEVLTALRKEGFEPMFAAQAKSRIEGKTEFTKHMIRLRHRNDFNKPEGANEVVLVNSHDGTCAYQLMAGFLRSVCQNSMVCGDIVEDQRVKHSGRIDDVIECTYRVLDQMDLVTESREGMQRLMLTDGEQRVFANAALGLRFGYNEQGQVAAPINEAQALDFRRYEDRGNDLWRTFGRLQENLIRGGIRGRNANGGRTTTREVQSVDGLVGLNKALWTLAQGMEMLKA